MWGVNSVIGKVFEVIIWPFRGLGPWPVMIEVSFLTGLLMLAIFGATSNQDGIRQAKNRIKAHLLELRLYQDSLAQQLKSQGRILAANGRYIVYALKPMLVMIIPVLLILVQLNLWFGSRSLRVGEAALVKLKLAEGNSPLGADVRLEAPPGLDIETPPLRIEDEREIDWRVKARSEGEHALIFHSGGAAFTKTVSVGRRPMAKIAVLKPGSALLDQIFNPGEKPLPGNAGIASVEVAFPARKMCLFGLCFHWLVAYFALSIIFGFAFKGVFKVEI